MYPTLLADVTHHPRVRKLSCCRWVGLCKNEYLDVYMVLKVPHSMTSSPTYAFANQKIARDLELFQYNDDIL